MPASTDPAASALEQCRQASPSPDLVLTDVVMPDENAFELLPRIKKLRPELQRHHQADCTRVVVGELG